MHVKQSFAARGSDGNDYKIYVWVRRIDTSTPSGQSSIEGVPVLRTSTGLTVEVLEKGRRYRILQTGVVLESSDPKPSSVDPT
jgi:hypothetical protein